MLLKTSASFLHKLLLSFFLATDLPSFVAVSGHEELRAKYRFRKVTGKDHTHLTREQFSDLLGPCTCTVSVLCLLPPFSLTFTMVWQWYLISDFLVCVASTLYGGSIQIC